MHTNFILFAYGLWPTAHFPLFDEANHRVNVGSTTQLSSLPALLTAMLHATRVFTFCLVRPLERRAQAQLTEKLKWQQIVASSNNIRSWQVAILVWLHFGFESSGPVMSTQCSNV